MAFWTKKLMQIFYIFSIWFKIPLITCTPLWFFRRLRQPVERGTVLVFLPGDYKLHMYFIVWTKQYSISIPKGCALPACSVCLVMTNAFTLAKEKNLCKTYLLRIVCFKDLEFWVPYKCLNNNQCLDPSSLKQLSYYNKNVTPSCQFLNWIEFCLNSDSIPPPPLQL